MSRAAIILPVLLGVIVVLWGCSPYQSGHTAAPDKTLEARVEQLEKELKAAKELTAAEKGEGPVTIHFADGWSFLDTAPPEGYDIVVVDLPDERADDADGQHNRLYGLEFVQRCQSVLSAGGVVAFQGGCPTVWRNETLIRAYNRFQSAFETVTYFGSDEHEWAFLFGRVEPIDDPINLMLEALPTSGYEPRTIDDASLIGATVAPYSLRNQS